MLWEDEESGSAQNLKWFWRCGNSSPHEQFQIIYDWDFNIVPLGWHFVFDIYCEAEHTIAVNRPYTDYCSAATDSKNHSNPHQALVDVS